MEEAKKTVSNLLTKMKQDKNEAFAEVFIEDFIQRAARLLKNINEGMSSDDIVLLVDDLAKGFVESDYDNYKSLIHCDVLIVLQALIDETKFIEEDCETTWSVQLF